MAHSWNLPGLRTYLHHSRGWLVRNSWLYRHLWKKSSHRMEGPKRVRGFQTLPDFPWILSGSYGKRGTCSACAYFLSFNWYVQLDSRPKRLHEDHSNWYLDKELWRLRSWVHNIDGGKRLSNIHHDVPPRVSVTWLSRLSEMDTRRDRTYSGNSF